MGVFYFDLVPFVTGHPYQRKPIHLSWQGRHPPESRHPVTHRGKYGPVQEFRNVSPRHPKNSFGQDVYFLPVPMCRSLHTLRKGQASTLELHVEEVHIEGCVVCNDLGPFK